MFDAAELRRVLRLHEKSYALLLWVNRGLASGRVALGRVAAALSFGDAALGWIRRYGDQLPEELRPAPADAEACARLFASYLSTSFEVVDGGRVFCRGCWCCSYWVEGRHLRARSPGRRAREVARELKLLYLRSLAPEAELGAVLGRKDLEPAISLATWAAELVRRSKFASQGEGVLVLWREIERPASGKARRTFKPDAAKILDAERKIQAALKC